jgi:hypothetical protein
MTSMRTFLVLIAISLCGCMSASRPSSEEQRAIDAWTSLCGSSESPIKPGMSRAQVHETLKERFYTGSKPDADLASGYIWWKVPGPRGGTIEYSSRRLGGSPELYKGQFPSGTMSWFGPNPEGDIVGKQRNYAWYVLEIDYDESGVVTRCQVLKRNELGRFGLDP